MSRLMIDSIKNLFIQMKRNKHLETDFLKFIIEKHSQDTDEDIEVPLPLVSSFPLNQSLLFSLHDKLSTLSC